MGIYVIHGKDSIILKAFRRGILLFLFPSPWGLLGKIDDRFQVPIGNQSQSESSENGITVFRYWVEEQCQYCLCSQQLRLHPSILKGRDLRNPGHFLRVITTYPTSILWNDTNAIYLLDLRLPTRFSRVMKKHIFKPEIKRFNARSKVAPPCRDNLSWI